MAIFYYGIRVSCKRSKEEKDTENDIDAAFWEESIKVDLGMKNAA